MAEGGENERYAQTRACANPASLACSCLGFIRLTRHACPMSDLHLMDVAQVFLQCLLYVAW